jgi:hypothetical protein
MADARRSLMLWKRFVEELQDRFVNLPPKPWRVTVDLLGEYGHHMIMGFNDAIIFSVPIPHQVSGETDDQIMDRISAQYQLLVLIVTMANHCDTWFDAMREAGINDLPAPKKLKRTVKPGKPWVQPEPVVGHITDFDEKNFAEGRTLYKDDNTKWKQKRASESAS